MSRIATLECYGRSWVAEQSYGEINRHSHIAVAALSKRIPFCRRHLLSPNRNFDPFLSEFSRQLKNNVFDLSVDFDTIIIQHDVGINPIDELNELENSGHQLVGSIKDVPDFAYLEDITSRGASIDFINSSLSPSEIDDLAIAQRSLTNMLLKRHGD